MRTISSASHFVSWYGEPHLGRAQETQQHDSLDTTFTRVIREDPNKRGLRTSCRAAFRSAARESRLLNCKKAGPTLAFSSLRSLSSSGFASASLLALTSNAACWARTTRDRQRPRCARLRGPGPEPARRERFPWPAGRSGDPRSCAPSRGKPGWPRRADRAGPPPRRSGSGTGSRWSAPAPARAAAAAAPPGSHWATTLRRAPR